MHSLFLFKLCPLRSRIVQQLNLFSPENRIHQRAVIKNLKKKNREKILRVGLYGIKKIL